MESLKYTEEDLDFDCDLFLSETEDLGSGWLGDFVVVNRKDGPSRHLEVLNSMSVHSRTLRLLNCVSSALEVEKENAILMSLDKVIRDQHQPATVISSTNTDSIIERTLADLPFQMSVNDIANVDDMLAKSTRPEEVMRQLKKDIERDTLLVNGVRIAGAQVGLTKSLQMVGDFCARLLSECSLLPLPAVMSEALSRVILSKASRTHAGGIALQSVRALIDPTTQMLIPQSSAALPLNVQLSVGAFPSVYDASLQRRGLGPVLRAWGVVCCVQCESVFQVQSMEEPLEASEDGLTPHTPSTVTPYVKVLYTDYVLLDLKLSPAEMTNIENIVSDSKELGTVSLSQL